MAGIELKNARPGGHFHAPIRSTQVQVVSRKTRDKAKMTRDLANRIQNSRTIWRETNSAPHHNGKSLLGLFQGQMVLANGETAVCAGTEVIDLTDESEPFAGYLIVLLADGSVSNQTFEGRLEFKEGDTIVGGKGTWKTVNGTGRFANFQSQGSFDWKANSDDYHAEYGGDTDTALRRT